MVSERESKEKALDTLQREGGRNVHIATTEESVDTSQFKKSTNFFARLQESTEGGARLVTLYKRIRQLLN